MLQDLCRSFNRNHLRYLWHYTHAEAYRLWFPIWKIETGWTYALLIIRSQQQATSYALTLCWQYQ